MTLPAVFLAAIFCLGLATPGTAADQPLGLGEAMPSSVMLHNC